MIGYVCINESLKPKNFKTCRLKSVLTKGVDYLRERVIHNLTLLKEILEWNIEHEIYMYRVLSDMVPLATHPDILEAFTWRWYEDDDILLLAQEIKDLVIEHDFRLSMHPDQYTVINSKNQKTVQNSRDNLAYHALLLDSLGGKDLILHVGGVYGDKKKAMERFISAYNDLDDFVKKYLRLENDDRSYGLFDVLDISQECHIPICFDYHHHRCLTNEEISQDMLKAIIASWKGARPKMHISSGSSHDQDRKHHDYISEEDASKLYQLLDGYQFDIMVEARRKEAAALRLRDQFIDLGGQNV